MPNTSICTVREDIHEAEQVVQANSATRVAWLILNIWPSHLGLPALVATIFFVRDIRRHATFVNLCVTWIIVGVSSSLLLYGGSQTGPEPPRFLCLTQASLLYGQPSLTSLSAFALVFQVFYVMWAAIQEKDPENHETLRKWTLLVVPYLGFIVFSVWSAFVGFNDPCLVSRRRRFFYCSVEDSSLTNTITAFSLAILLITVCLELGILFIIVSHWRVFRANGLGANTGTDVNLICRTSAFALYIFLGMGLSALSIKAPRSAVPDMALATMGSMVVLVFGTQRDIIQAWMLWRRKGGETRRPSGRTESPSSVRSGVEKPSPSLDSLETVQEWQMSQDQNDCNVRSKPTGPVSVRDISQPVLREDLTFTVFGRAI